MTYNSRHVKQTIKVDSKNHHYDRVYQWMSLHQSPRLRLEETEKRLQTLSQ